MLLELIDARLEIQILIVEFLSLAAKLAGPDFLAIDLVLEVLLTKLREVPDLSHAFDGLLGLSDQRRRLRLPTLPRLYSDEAFKVAVLIEISEIEICTLGEMNLSSRELCPYLRLCC